MSDTKAEKSSASNKSIFTTSVGVQRPLPFTLHNSKSPSRLFVGELLTKTNYEDFDAWKQGDAMVKGWLKTAMSKDVRSSVRFAITAREISVDVQTQFGHGSVPRLYELHQTINLLQQEKTSVASFYTKLRGLWDEINSLAPSLECTSGGCTCDVNRRQRESEENERLFDILMGLDDAFGIIKTQILAMIPTPSLANAYLLP
ncbi:unnamed protein product [Linum trigynum]|uniref:Uncharacterized protein n=1 Tax=Linum trigynum TaxID=586398 RepID=A0AAV2F6C7_9ROSI